MTREDLPLVESIKSAARMAYAEPPLLDAEQRMQVDFDEVDALDEAEEVQAPESP